MVEFQVPPHGYQFRITFKLESRLPEKDWKGSNPNQYGYHTNHMKSFWFGTKVYWKIGTLILKCFQDFSKLSLVKHYLKNTPHILYIIIQFILMISLHVRLHSVTDQSYHHIHYIYKLLSIIIKQYMTYNHGHVGTRFRNE